MLSRWWHNQWDDGWNLQRTMTRFMGWRLEKSEVVRCTEFWQAAQRHLWRTTRVVYRFACISDRSVASSSMHLFYKNQHPSSHPLLFAKNTLSERVRHLCQRSVRSTLASLNLICSLFSSVNDTIRLVCFLFSAFILPFFIKNLCFLHPSPFFNPSVLGSVTTCWQCLVCQVTSRSSMTGRVTRNCTRRVLEIQTI